MSRKVFFDTNVVLDILFERKPFFEAAQLLMNRILRSGEKPLMSSVTAVNINYSANKIHGRAKAYTGLGQLLQSFIITSVDSKIIRDAHQAHWKDFEDAMQYFSAKAAGVDLIVTRDVEDYEEQEIPVLTPEEARAVISKHI